MPNEVLTEIFQYLIANKNRNQVQSDLLNATLVCKKWNQIVSGTASLMDKVKFTLEMDKDEAANEQLQLFHSNQRKITNTSCAGLKLQSQHATSWSTIEQNH